MATPFPNIPVSQASSIEADLNLNRVSFGGGYEQVVPMGINYNRERWNVQWNALTLTQYNSVLAFLQSVANGSIITWTPPFQAAQKKFRLDGGWSVVNRGGQIFAVQFNIRQVFDVI